MVAVEVDQPLWRDEQAPLAPARQRRNEVCGRRQFHVHLKFFLDRRNVAQQRFQRRVEFQVDVDRRGLPIEPAGRAPLVVVGPESAGTAD